MSEPIAAPEQTARRAEESSLWVLAITGLLLATAAAAWWIELRPALQVDPTPLAGISRVLDGWRSEEIPIEDDVAEMLRADFNLMRSYVHPLAPEIYAYVGYYGTRRGGRPEHTPRVCYESQGWTLLADRTLEIDSDLGLRVNELVVDRDGERRLVHFWYRSQRGTGVLSTSGLVVHHAIGQLLDGRADGALVRLSTRLDDADDVSFGRSRLIDFGRRFERELASHWPREYVPAGS